MSGSDLFTGTLDLLILRVLVSRPLHGYGIRKTLNEAGGGALSVEEGALYPALHRLERRGLLSSDWGKTATGRRAKFYQITPAGWRHLEAEADRWSRYSVMVSSILAGEGLTGD